ncbi:hypothetical protein SBRCBS47491_006664 [Sporothrix bragantina]|uniref:Sfi1 spindle body domain-containing protein n=1 Tax=Sporothrix bragantina TaxID=671064 RepID=A0ABP0C6V2_9PEZI
MPSHAPLSSRDGRIRSSSVHQGGEPFYYSNEDIELLHQVVALAQDILPTLPKRDKLPNTALFRAADIIFPRYGLDPDTDDKLNRIIFMVGGMRSTDNLLDRFRTVLGGMGIELEYVPDHDGHDDQNDVDSEGGQDEDVGNVHSHRRRRSHIHASPPSPQPPSSPMSVHSAVPSSTGGIFPVAGHVNGRRRRNSDSIAELVAAAAEGRFDRGRREHDRQQRQPQQSNRPPARQHHRRRSDSLAPPLRNYKGHFGLRDELRLPQPNLPPPQPQPRPSRAPWSIDPWLSQVPRYPAALDKDEDLRNLDNAQDVEADDEDFDSDNEDVPDVDDYTRSLDVLLASAPHRHEQQHQKQKQKQKHALPDIIGARNTAHLYHNHNYQHHQHHQPLPTRTRTLLQSLPPSAHPAVSFDVLSHSAHSSVQPAGSWTEPQSPRSRVSSLATDYEGFQGASDTTIQEELEAGPAPKVDPYIMAKVADTFFMRFAFLGGVAIDAWRTMAAAHQDQEQYAAQMDRELSLSEALVVWSNAAGMQIDDTTRRPKDMPVPVDALHIDHHPARIQQHSAIERHERNDRESQHEDEAEAEDNDENDEAAVQYRQKQDERERLMRRAARVYAITTMFNAVTHWQAMAKEEASRTKVARRHLLRRKVFSAWRDQTAVDHVKADRFALGWAVRRWTTALHRVQEENAQLAVQFYRRDLVTVTFWTWFRANQKRTADSWASNRLKKQAVDWWRESTIIVASVEEAAASVAQNSLLRMAANKWSEQAESQALTLLSIEEQENETYIRAALQDWSREAFCQKQLRAVRAANETRTKTTVLQIWREAAADAKHRASQLDLDIVDEYTTHWRRETNLALFRADYEYDLKAEAVHSWALAEKLAFFLRYRDERLLRNTCLTLKATFGSGKPGQKGEQERELELARAADRLDKTNALCGLVFAFRDLGEKRGALGQIAEYLNHEALATASLGPWTAAVEDHREMDEVAQRGAFYVGTANALSGWPAYAKDVRKERLRTTYHTFRREVKRQTAAKYLAVWRDATLRQGTEARGSGFYVTADQLRYEHETHTIFTTLNHWILETNDRLFQQSVAAEADAEVYLSHWRLQLAEYEEFGAAAAEHDTVTQLAGRWDDWELQAVQARAREHTASALQDKNDRRLGRRVLAVWQQELADQLYLGSVGPNEDLRASIASSSGPRWRGEETRGAGGYSASLGVGVNTGVGMGIRRLGASLSSPFGRSDEVDDVPESVQLAGEVTRGTRTTSFLLHPITETPVTTTAQRPFNGRGGRATTGGSYSVPAPGTAAPPGEAVPQLPHQPSSGAKQLRRLHRSTATAPYQQHEQKASGQQQPTQQPAPFRSSTSPETLITPARVTPYSHRLLQRRLQSAVRLADSVQLGPMSEFDEVDAMDGVEAGDDDLGLKDYADADVSSEGDEDSGLGHDNTPLVPTARSRHELLFPTAAHAADTPTRPLFRPSSSERTAVPSASSSQTPLPSQLHSNLRSAATVDTATPANIGGMSYSVSNLRAPADSRFARYGPAHKLLRKSAAAGAAAASGAAYSSYPSSFDPITTTPMGPLPSPFERRLRAAYGDGASEASGNNNTHGNEDYSVGQRASLATVTPLRRLPLRASLAASTATARTGARVTFADVEHDQGEE